MIWVLTGCGSAVVQTWPGGYQQDWSKWWDRFAEGGHAHGCVSGLWVVCLLSGAIYLCIFIFLQNYMQTHRHECLDNMCQLQSQVVGR